MSSVAVIGSGTWGTAIAHLIAGKNVAVRMWTRSADVADAINAAHRNPRHLPDVELAGVTASASFEESLRGVDAAIFVCPSSYLRSIALSCAPFIASDLPVIVLTKGIEAQTGFTMVELLEDVLGNPSRIATERDDKARHLGKATCHERRRRVIAQLHGDAHAVGDGDDVLRGGAKLHTRHV